MSNNIDQNFVNEPILPDGFNEGEDFFADNDEEAPTTEPSVEAEPNEEEPDEEVPTTEPEAGENDLAEDSEEKDPTIEPNPEPKQTIKVKYNHEEREVAIDEAATLIQMGLNYEKKARESEALKQRLERAEQLALRIGYKNPDEMLEAVEQNLFEQRVAELVEDGVHEAIARDLVQREWERQKPPTPKKDPLVDEINEFVRLNPTVDKLPDEVIQSVTQDGVPLLVAYERYKSKQALEELRILKQNQAAATRAPVVSATKHGSTKQKSIDAFEAGFDSDPW